MWRNPVFGPISSPVCAARGIPVQQVSLLACKSDCKSKIRGKDGLEIFTDGDRIILRKYEPGFVFCNETEDITEFSGEPFYVTLWTQTVKSPLDGPEFVIMMNRQVTIPVTLVILILHDN